MSVPHTPVLLNEMLKMVSSKSGETYVDGTFGAGGYTSALLKSADCFVYGIDRDGSVKKYAEKINRDFPDRFQLFIDKFGNIDKLMKNKKVDAIILDLGVSSMQLEESNRGFSFMKDGPLDMRMSNTDKIDATALINAFREEEIADVIYRYGNERYAKKIALAIIRYRNKKLIKTTGELAEIIRSVVPRTKHDKIDPATRTFQAIRIWVNDELTELEKGIDSAVKILEIGGRLVIISFHSLEDKIVKNKFNFLCGKKQGISRYLPEKKENRLANFTLLDKKVVKPTKEEINLNPRARSARLRGIRREL
ncbi:MAG: 16S rRNA (cytosine(1402)-N(4))-methyltransferase RsmH [Rickettsiaceae bacterium H1]|nr:16S rRNA (cytosine(1402)-N(4))-methyltransferase RsmH [Rickettsiaceae bacterium H1]